MAPENIDSLYELATFLDKLGVDEINFQHLWYTNKIVAKTHKEVLSNEFGLLDNGVDSHVVEEQHEITSKNYADKVANFTQMLLRNIVKFRSTISFYPLLSKNEIIKYYTDNTFSKYKYCIAPWNEITIKANGDVMFCPDEWITEFKLGNVKENSIDQLWNNEQAQKFRSFIIKKGRFPICNHCCFLFNRTW
jgi:radical SAM protein with 4Fe4S-binding SPASM domain